MRDKLGIRMLAVLTAAIALSLVCVLPAYAVVDVEVDMSGPVPTSNVGATLVDHGVWGESHWWFYSNGYLEITQGEGVNRTSPAVWPWYGYNEKIRSVYFSRTVLPSESSSLFAGASNLELVNMRTADASKVTTLFNAFQGCGKLKKVVLPETGVSNVITLSDMFHDCSSLESGELDLSKLASSKVQWASGMFYGCSSLKSVDLSFLAMSKPRDLRYLLAGCTALETADFSAVNASATTNLAFMLARCTSLKSVNLTGFDTSSATQLNGVFSQCSSLESLDVSSFVIRDDAILSSNLVYTNMFDGCTTLKSVKLGRGFKFYLANAAITLPDNGEWKGPSGARYSYLELAGLWDGSTMAGTYTVVHSLSDAEVGGLGAVTYTGANIEAAPTVTYSGKQLVRGTDFTLSWTDNLNAGTATVKIAATDTGEFYGTRDVTFTIAPAPIAKGSFKLAEGTYAFTGKAHEPALSSATFAGKALVAGTDFSLSYRDNVYAGTGYAVLSGKGNFTGTAELSFAIARAPMASATFTLGRDSFAYTGAAVKPTFSVAKLGDVDLVEDVDYKVEWRDNIEVGKASGTITGLRSLEGTREVSFSIVNSPIDGADIALELDGTSFAYTGAAIEPHLKTATAPGGEALEEGYDYTISWKDNVNVGQATAIVEGAGSYTGKKELRFNITRAPISSATMKLSASKLAYTGSKLQPKLAWATFGGRTLTQGTDYTISWSSNKKPGTAVATVRGKGNFAGTRSLPFTITKAQIADASFKLAKSSYAYNGAARKPGVKTAAFNGQSLVQGTDFTMSWKANRNAGNAYAVITGMGNFTGKANVRFTIKPISISKATFKLVKTTLAYTGKALKPKVKKAKLASTMLKKGSDFTVTYTGAKDIGKAKATISGKGNYTGSKKLTYTVKPSAPSAKAKAHRGAIVGSARGIDVSWTFSTGSATASKLDGCFVQISSSAEFPKGAKTVTVTAARGGANAKVFERQGALVASGSAYKLKAKTTYYVRVGAYKGVGGARLLTWSKPAKCTMR
ncbi:MAG: BspA family leucine-rich repeat surface protein [Eggerthellaceae bacterium]|nr:BspA family leucine-rich repeat surface protein [Eggerthellaceae bacterium]